MTTSLPNLSCMLATSKGETKKTTDIGQHPNTALLTSLQGHHAWCHSVSKLGAISMPVCSYDESPGCSIGKSRSLYLSKSILSRILSSLWLLSMIDMLRSIVKVYQPLTHNSLTQVLSSCFTNSSSCNPTGHTSLAKVGSVACSLDSSQSFYLFVYLIYYLIQWNPALRTPLKQGHPL